MKLIASVIFMFCISVGFTQDKTIYDFTVEDINGKAFDLSTLKGKKVMIVNTASKCGLTPQYEQLQSIYEQYGGDDFVIIGFPANNFMGQEPGSEEEIATFCQKNYGVTFPMMSKISVKGGDIHPLYKFLTEEAMGDGETYDVKWNFQKFLINEKGQLEKVISPREKPDSEAVVSWIKA
jgi:glutathione peroxidase